MKKLLVYDLPTRIFHGLFAILFLAAFMITKLTEDESPTFTYHMLAGVLLSSLVVLRILWGGLGPRYARFSGFALRPRDLIAYFKDLGSGGKKKWAGHNPASSWAAILMMIMALGLGTTGYLMTSTSNKEAFEEIHEVLANGFLVVALAHIVGVILHTIRHRDSIALSMVTGQKREIQEGEEISSSYRTVGVLLLAWVAAFSFYLKTHYDSEAKCLRLFGTMLQLGENKGARGAAGEQEQEHEHHHEQGHEDHHD